MNPYYRTMYAPPPYPYPQPYPPQYSSRGGGSGLKIAIALILVLLVLGVAGGVIYYLYKKKTAPVKAGTKVYTNHGQKELTGTAWHASPRSTAAYDSPVACAEQCNTTVIGEEHTPCQSFMWYNYVNDPDYHNKCVYYDTAVTASTPLQSNPGATFYSL